MIKKKDHKQIFNKLLPIIAGLILGGVLSSCSHSSLIEQLGQKDRPRVGILTIQITAPLEKKYLVKDLEDRATQKLISSLKEMSNFEPVFIPRKFLSLKRGQRPSRDQVKLVLKKYEVEALFFAEIPWYGKTRLLYPLLFESLDIAAETIVLGVLTKWNPTLIAANIGFDLLTSTPLWFGGAYIFGWAFRPVSINAYVYRTRDGEEIWSEEIDQISAGEELKKFPKEERKKKEVQLEASMNNALIDLSNALNGRKRHHFAKATLLLGASSLNGEENRFTYGLSAAININSDWQIGGQFNMVSPRIRYSTLSNFDVFIKRITGRLSYGILFGLNLAELSFNKKQETHFNAGLSLGYDWEIGTTDFSIGPQIDYLWSPMQGGHSFINGLVALKYAF